MSFPPLWMPALLFGIQAIIESLGFSMFSVFSTTEVGEKSQASLWPPLSTHKDDLPPIWQPKPIISLPSLPSTPLSALNSAMLRNNMF